MEIRTIADEIREPPVMENRPQRLKFLVFSKEGWCWNMAEWLRDEGHEVACYIHEDYAKHLGDGFISDIKVDDFREVLRGDRSREWIIVFDNIGLGKIADELKRHGWRVWGASQWADRIEKDREYGRRVCEIAGIKSPPTYTARTIPEAINFIRSNPNKYVLKPHDNKVAVYISYDMDDAIGMLQHWEKLGLERTEVDIQTYIVGRNVDVEFIFGNGYPLFPPNYTVETKYFMPGECGPIVGCMTSVVWTSTMRNRIYDEIFKQIFPVVRRYKWTGPLSLNIIVEDDTNELYVLEFTPRIGYNAYFCLKHLLPNGFSDLIWRCVSVNDDNSQDISLRMINTDTARFSVGLEVSIPPYPFEHPDKKKMAEIYGAIKGRPLFIEGTYPAKIYLCDVYKNEEGVLCAGGTNGIIAEIIAENENAEAAWNKCVETFHMLRIRDKQARLFDGIDDFLKYYPKWVEKGIVGGVTPSSVYETSP